ncbi:transposase [Trichocoleus sp. FACHB-46]|nr:transposase [Trichocoleus sp. FACHB-46]
MDLRQRILNAYEAKEGSQRQLAKRFKVSLSFGRDLMRHYRATGTVQPKPHGGGTVAKLGQEHLPIVAVLVQAQPDALLAELCERFCQQTGITDYAKHWGIETLFGIFKSRGFCLESTHLSDGERLNKLLALLSLVLCWIFLTGEWLHQLKPLVVKKHGRRAKSLFRYGFDHLRHIVLNLEHKGDQFSEALQFLFCT